MRPELLSTNVVLAYVVGLFSIIAGPFSRNVGRLRPMFSANLGPN
jgi:hypothetical protein